MNKTLRPARSSRGRLGIAGSWIIRDLAYRGRTLVAAVLLLAALLAIGGFAWRKWSASIGSRDEYVITADRVHLTPPPPWLKPKIAAEALEAAGLSEGLSLIDGEVIDRLVEALELHPWIDRVVRVEKQFPARIEAQVSYRVPIAAVEVNEERLTPLCPIDVQGVRLPANDLPQTMLVRLPRVADAGQLPLVGQAFDGSRMAGALNLISYLKDEWAALSLWVVTPLPHAETHGEHSYLLFDVTTRGGTRIHWGAAPGAAPPDEAPPEQKLSRLKGYIEAHQVDLQSVRSPQVIDVRRDVQVKPRMAARPDEPTE